MGQPLVTGRVTPPKDMIAAAKKTLGERYEAFIKKYGENFTPKQLCEFHEAR